MSGARQERRDGGRHVSKEELPLGRVAIVGPGRLGTVLAAALARAGHRIVAAGGGGEAARARFRTRFRSATAFADPAAATVEADLVVVATPDDVVERVVVALSRADAVGDGQRVVHVAGSMGLAPLRAARLAGARIAACHPAQTVPAADAPPEVLLGAPWAVTTAPADRGWARALVNQVGGLPYEVADDRRALYHAALVMGSNAVGAAVAAARQLLVAARIHEPATFLATLSHESVENVLLRGAGAITGPVARADVGTLRRHLDELDAEVPTLAVAYRALSTAILSQVRPSLAPERSKDVEAALTPDVALPCSRPTASGADPAGEG
ncbi:MAG: DUF2520 domain-containing protein [Actinomycetota bacterium]|nr:DUF2520 domain-containing protein [Actinomycetota bacterium]